MNNNSRKNKQKSPRTYVLAVLLLGFFSLLLIDPENTLESGKKAVDLCLNIIVPSLLPFFVISRLIMKTGAIHTISRIFSPVIRPLFNLPGAAAFPLIAGWFSGYPAGAKYTTDLLNDGLLKPSEAQRLLAFCNNSGPLFIVGAVGTGYFKSPELGMVLLVCHILASMSVGIGSGILSRLSRLKDPKPELLEKKLSGKKEEFSGQLLTDAIIDSMRILLQISGTIIFFAVLVQALETMGIFSTIGKLFDRTPLQDELFTDTAKVFMAGSLEVTYGLYLLSRSANIPMNIKILLTAFLCGFGGFSVLTQVSGIVPNRFKLKKYIYGKLAHGFLAALYTGIFMTNRIIPVMTYSSRIYGANTSKILLFIYAFILILGIIGLVRHQLICKHK